MSEGALVGWVGLGHMGIPMSARLVQGGADVLGYDVSPSARHAARANGIEEAATLRDVATRAGIVILMLPNSDVVEAVMTDEAFLGSLRHEALIVDMSSSGPLRTRALAGALSKRDLRLIDAPVSGGVAGAQAGNLTVMVGAGLEELQEARPYLERFGRVVHAGPVGAGHAVKALNNLMSATHLWATSEAVIAGQRFGLDPEVLLSIVNSSSGRSGSTENKWPNFILPGTYNSGFGLQLMVKDMAIAVALAQEVGSPTELSGQALTLWSEASRHLPDDADHTEVARWLAEQGPSRATN